MALFPLGILSAAGAGGVFDYEQIATTVLGTATSTITFSNLGNFASTYRHLQIRTTARSSITGNADNLAIQINGDSGANYSYHRLVNQQPPSNSVESAGAGSLSLAFILPSGTPTSSLTANSFAGGVIDILDPFSTTKNKTLRSLSGYTTASYSIIQLASAAWLSTSSVTSFVISNSGNFVAGSRFSLYGIRG